MNKKNINQIEFVHPASEKMERITRILIKAFISFKIPKEVKKKTGIRHVDEIQEPWLIVLCDETAPADALIDEKISEFTKAGNYERILTLLVSGEPQNSFPHSLLYEEDEQGNVTEHEPLAANIVSASEKESLRLLKTEKLRLLAPILGVTFDKLNNRRRKQVMRRVLIAGCAATAAACAFLAFAAVRSSTISEKNQELETQYAAIDQARIEAEQERDEAEKQLAGSIAVDAALRLEEGDSELALLLALEFLPGAGEGTEMEKVLDNALNRLCAAGYVPVTNDDAYVLDRYEEEPDPDIDCPFADTIHMRIPDGYKADRANSFSMKRKAWSKEYGYAVYEGDFEQAADEEGKQGGKAYFSRICYLNDASRDRYLIDENEKPVWFYNPVILPDGRFADVIWDVDTGYQLYVYDPVRETFSDISQITTRIGGAYLKDLHLYEGCNYLIGETSLKGDSSLTAGIFVYDAETFEYLYTLDGIQEFETEEGVSFLFGRTGKTIDVYAMDPFEKLFSIEDELSGNGPALYAAQYPDGSAYMVLFADEEKAIYDLHTGERIAFLSRRITDGSGVEGNLSFDNEFSSEGLFVTAAGNTPVIYDAKTGKEIDRIAEAGDNPLLYGPYDEATGLRSAKAIRCGRMYYVYEYRKEAIPVPDSLEEKLELAKKLLNGRELTESEKTRYGLGDSSRSE